MNGYRVHECHFEYQENHCIVGTIAMLSLDRPASPPTSSSLSMRRKYEADHPCLSPGFSGENPAHSEIQVKVNAA